MTLRKTILSLCVLLAACGGGSNKDCSFTACGGSPVGEWRLTSACDAPAMPITPAGTMTPCAGSSIGTQTSTTSGTASVKADMTYVSNYTLEGSGTASAPAACLHGVTNCPDLAQSLSQAPNLLNASCSGNAMVSCQCQFQFSQAVRENGTWALNGNQIVLTPMGMGSGGSAEICQQGNTLRAKLPNGQILVFSR